MPEWLKTLLSSSVTAAIVGATAVWLYNNGLARNARRTDFLKEHMRNVYGPVTYLFEAANMSFQNMIKVSNGYDEYFATRHGHERFSQEMHEVIAVQNAYGARMADRNKEVAAVLKANWGWLDPDDIEDLGKFLGILKNSLGSPVCFRGIWVEQFRQKLRSKQDELSPPRRWATLRALFQRRKLEGQPLLK